MTKYQLWSRDEYGQGSILDTSEDLQSMIKKAKDLVTDANVNNALTVEEKKRNWVSYYVELEPIKAAKTTQIVYAGKSTQNKDAALKISKGKQEIIAPDSDVCKTRIFLGKLDKEDWYAADYRRNEIDSLKNADLVGKTVYYIKKIG